MGVFGSIFISRSKDKLNELDATTVIEAQSPFSAPDGEILRCDIDLFDQHPLLFEKLQEALRDLKPLLEGKR